MATRRKMDKYLRLGGREEDFTARFKRTSHMSFATSVNRRRHEESSVIDSVQKFLKIAISSHGAKLKIVIMILVSILHLIAATQGAAGFASNPQVAALHFHNQGRYPTPSGSSSSASGGQNQNLIVFPSSSVDESNQQKFRRQNPSAAVLGQKRAPAPVYVNPQPSTLSGKYNSEQFGKPARLQQQQQDQNRAPTVSSGSNQNFYQPPIGSRPAIASASQARPPLGSTPSSIGKSEQSQVAEWPFFKSFQMVRNNQMMSSGQLMNNNPQNLQAASSTTIQPTTVALANTPSEGPEQDMRRLMGPTQPPTSTSTTSTTTTTTTSTTTTTTTTTTPEPPPETPSMAPQNPETTTTGEPLTSSTTTTTAAPTTSTSPPIEEEPATEDEKVMGVNELTRGPLRQEDSTSTSTQRPPAEMLKEQMMIPARVHSSIQSAVNKLVEMGTRVANQQKQQPAPAEANTTTSQQQSAGAPQVVRLNGNSKKLRSSLSLNVLLKNFGAFNLTSLDQILLKSSLSQQPGKNSTTSPLPRDHQKIEINGINHLEHGNPNDLDTNSYSVGENGGGGGTEPLKQGPNQQQAECKIEYTMKHVNISLANDDEKSDYTCDYIIDRKLAMAQGGSVDPEPDGRGQFLGPDERICRLHLRSEFFSNHSTRDLAGATGLGAENERQICSGSTYLAIGKMRFCHIGAESSEGLATPQLDRVFAFPVQVEAFDIRLVHRSGLASKGRLGGKSSGGGEIYLEIKPIVDTQESCMQMGAAGFGPSGYQGAAATRRPATSSRIEYLSAGSGAEGGELSQALLRKPKQPAGAPRQLSSTEAPQVSRDNDDPGVVPIQNGSPIGASRRKFVLKQAPERQLHPINHHQSRFKQLTSQTFDVDRTTARPSDRSDTPPGRPAESESPISPGLAPLCENEGLLSGVHVATTGTIATPNYPQNYTTNMRCRHIIKRVSRAHCKLLLHFRDFDLTPTAGDGSDLRSMRQDCPGDYLQIGETRYCNRYAMTGYKMYLNFSEAATAQQVDPQNSLETTEAIALLLNSDASRTGRGFLIKYQQLLCADQEPTRAEVSKFDSSVRTGNELAEKQFVARLQTLAPPLQQPDFSLALKTNKPPVGSPTGGGAESAATQAPGAKPTRAPPSERRQKQARDKKQQAQRRNETSAAPQLQPMASTPAASGSGPASLLLAESPTTTTTTTLTRREALGGETNEQSVQCNRVNHEMNFLLSSHNYPGAYLNNLACLYYIRRNSSKVCYLEMTFLKFDLEPDSDCRYDFLEINNVRLCGTLKQETTRIYLFEEAVKLIKFKSDPIGVRGGFLIRVEQLECAPNGSILRTGPSESANLQLPPSTTGELARNSSVFEYDAPLATTRPSAASGQAQRRLAANSTASSSGPQKVQRSQTGGGASPRRFDFAQQQQSSAAAALARQQPAPCDEVLYGSEITIKSPGWPESYANDESLNSCKYTILRNNFAGAGRAATCQLELRFVQLRLGSSDCLDIDGMEILCGFNARNLVKYYPFGERQSHLTITFTTGSGTAKLFSARSATPPYSHHLNADLLPLSASSPQQQQQQQQNHSDLLPSSRAPLRFMILARQLECIDDFLAPQVELDPSTPSGGGGGSLSLPGRENATSLLYATNLNTKNSLRPRYVNRTAVASQTRRVSATNETQLSYDPAPGSPSSPSLGKLGEPQVLTPGSIPAGNSTSSRSSSSTSSDGVLMYSFAESLGGASRTGSGTSGACLIQFNQFNGILASSNILRSRLESRASPLGECEIRLKLLPGFCKIQLNFGEFDLYPGRVGGSQLCPGEYLELGGVQYCGQELQNSTRVLSTTLASQRHISLRSGQTSHNSFRAIFKQLECDPLGQLRPLGPGVPMKTVQLNESQPVGQFDRPSSLAAGTPSIDFREIPIRQELFELNSAKLARQSSFLYDPNMFLIFKLRRAKPGVCKVRLMFYKFDLEAPSPLGCKRDFLDINNQDRLCGSMDFRFEESTREYDWPPSRAEFQISFVSDGQNQRPGFHIFGQQVADPEACGQSGKESAAANKKMSPSSQPMGSGETPSGQQFEDMAGPARGTTPNQMRTNKVVVGQAAPSQVVDQTPPAGQRVAPLPANCSSIINGERHFELASPAWPQQYDGIGSCHYLVRRAGPEICSLALNVNSLILNINPTPPQSDATPSQQQEGVCNHLTEAELAREDYLDLDGQVKLCGLITRPRSFRLDFTQQRQFVVLKFVSNSAHGFGFHLEAHQVPCELPSANVAAEISTPAPSTGSDKSRKQNSLQTQSFDRDVITYDDAPSPGRAPASTEEVTPPQTPAYANEGGSSQSEAPTAEVGAQQEAGRQSSASCNRLFTDQHTLLESENFPGNYPNNLDCLFAFRRMNQSVCAIDLLFNYFDLENSGEAQTDSSAGGTCENDYLEIDYSRFCGSYPAGHKLRFNYFDQELDKLVRFRTDSSKSRPGFSIMVSQWLMGPGEDECQTRPPVVGLPGALSAGPDQTQGVPGRQQVSSNEREVINYLPDSTGGSTSHVAHEPTAQHQNSTSFIGAATSAAQQQPSSTLCQFSYFSDRQVLVSPNYNPLRSYYDNNLDCQYKIVASSYDICALRLTFIDLDLEASPGCLNDYLLIDSKRYCGQLENLPPGSNQQFFDWQQQQNHLKQSGRSNATASQLGARTSGTSSRLVTLELDFDANLPREIDILFHTDSHANSGRGFKLLSEQVPCGLSGGPGSPPSHNQHEPGASGPESSPADHLQDHQRQQQPAAADQEFKLQQHNHQAADQMPGQIDAQSVAAARQVRRMRFGQLSYPKNYVSSQQQQQGGPRGETNPRAWRENRPKMTLEGQQRANEQHRIERMTSGRSLQAGEPSDSSAGPQQSPDLRLSKEIVVTRTDTKPGQSARVESE